MPGDEGENEKWHVVVKEECFMIINDIYFDLKDGRKALLRSPKEEDVDGTLEYLRISAGETDFILRYPEECAKYTPESEKKLFERKNESPNEAMIMCVVDGRVVGNCEISFRTNLKTRHRASVAIALISEFWNQGIGTRMFQELIRLAEERGDILQLELDFVEGNSRARALYEKMGFRITGVRPDALRLKDGTLLNEYLMVRKV
jgi:RimJ/RimL family protein N-acetyltransferase